LEFVSPAAIYFDEFGFNRLVLYSGDKFVELKFKCQLIGAIENLIF